MATAIQLMQNNREGRYILEDYAHVSSGLSSCVPPEPPEPPDTSTPYNGRAQWYLGFLHVMSGMANLIMTIPLQVKRNVGHWATKLKLIKVDNNGIKPATPEWDKGVPCACPSRRSCSIYDTCRCRCIRTMDRLGVGLPILRESGTERLFEAANEVMKRHIDTRRVKRSKSTRRLEGSYRHLLKQITSYLCHLVEDDKLPYSVLKRWVYSLRLDLRAQFPERNPGVEKLLNEFYSRFYDTERLRELMVKVEGYLTRPPTVKMALQKFEDEVDTFLSSRVFLHGFNKDGQQNAMFCVDPEWSVYPARDLYQIHKRVREALQRVRGQLYIVIFFCTVLTEYMLLNNVEDFVQKIIDRVERQPMRIDETDGHVTSPLSEEAADTPSRSALFNENESAKVEDQIECKASGNSHSVLVPGIELVPSDIVSSLASEGGWSSFEYAVSVDNKHIPLLLNEFKPFYSVSP